MDVTPQRAASTNSGPSQLAVLMRRSGIDAQGRGQIEAIFPDTKDQILVLSSLFPQGLTKLFELTRGAEGLGDAAGSEQRQAIHNRQKRRLRCAGPKPAPRAKSPSPEGLPLWEQWFKVGLQELLGVAVNGGAMVKDRPKRAIALHIATNPFAPFQ
jgi:hypothetical protein